jgi:hypothetical protein
MLRNFGHAPLGVRWTIGDVSPQGFAALRLSIHAAVRLFGPDTAYAVCVNTITPDEAQRRTGTVSDRDMVRGLRGTAGRAGTVPRW